MAGVLRFKIRNLNFSSFRSFVNSWIKSSGGKISILRECTNELVVRPFFGEAFGGQAGIAWQLHPNVEIAPKDMYKAF
ncbi:hypothetical protein A2716_00440 [candidate division WWE3 bacterium RIFCSPHIGHO2_01_FULL_40_23]|uniref:Uncharacterized protein n=1 Tax=candidate division WWE3 bacterium RIFCSPLOWO2_01_FULL_41_18 TaxID=1802625 RepID=A0A1F4VE66_UNCKA|nr:MAG: hypothetical protein A2716_00440 [candidate division WWE3 bacterium RIFCSPHIGHO2_01_FULL_40_23]OGC55464.1 MAG: hypothetical protein A3A78_00710 [candidate division WWE3 bacterium RIFCSPLOWO2_01_FULL_41_18]